jgi:hypothetical protein
MIAPPMRSLMHSIRAAGSGLCARRLLAGSAVIAVLSCVAGARRPNTAAPAAAPSAGAASESEEAAQGDPSEESAEPESSGDAHSYADDAPPRRVREASGKYNCESPRPRVCEATPNPVCASKSANGSSQEEPVTVLNGCLACADPIVVSYVEGRCLASKNSSVPSAPSKGQ